MILLDQCCLIIVECDCVSSAARPLPLLFLRPLLQRVGFLPARDSSQEEVSWVTLEEAQPLADVDWQVVTFTPPPEQENLQYRKYRT